MSLIYPTKWQLKKILPHIKILNKDTQSVTSFELRKEQEKILDHLLGRDLLRLCVLKSRQIGSSTLIALVCAWMLIKNKGQTRIGLVTKDKKTAKFLLAYVRSFIEQLAPGQLYSYNALEGLVVGEPNSPSYTHRHFTVQVVTNQSSKESITQTFAGGSCQLMWISEMAFFKRQDAFSSIMASVGNGALIVESTGNGRTGEGESFYKLYTESRGFDKLFFSVEDAEQYQMDPNTLTEEEWYEAQTKHGFSSRSHAAYWYNLKWTGNLSDLELYRQFPITDEHPFDAHGERYYGDLPKEPVPAEVIHLQTTPDVPLYKFNDRLKDEPVLCGVDTAAGVGKDATALAIFGKASGKLLATYRNNLIKLEYLPSLLLEIQSMYPSVVYVIENNGLGQTTIAGARQHHLVFREVNTRDKKRTLGLMETIKSSIEASRIPLGKDLLEECIGLRLGEDERFKGKKDLLMAITFVIEDVQSYSAHYKAFQADSSCVKKHIPPIIAKEVKKHNPNWREILLEKPNASNVEWKNED